MDAETFEAALDVNPADFGCRLAYSDWLEEWGEVGRADFLRWTVKNQKVPSFNPSTGHDTPWGWDRGPIVGWDDDGWHNMDVLPSVLFDWIPELEANEAGDKWLTNEGRIPETLVRHSTSYFYTRRSAEAALFAAWVAAGRPEGLE